METTQHRQPATGITTDAFRWTRKGGLAVLDQRLFSGANFLVNILLARWLEPKEYGAFAVALSVFYLLAALHADEPTYPYSGLAEDCSKGCFSLSQKGAF